MRRKEKEKLMKAILFQCIQDKFVYENMISKKKNKCIDCISKAKFAYKNRINKMKNKCIDCITSGVGLGTEDAEHRT